MKYIRTKDGIYETLDYDQLPNNLKKQLDEREHSCMKDYKKIGVFAKMKQGALSISNIQPILLFAIQNQADTIEELCDYVIRKPVGSVDDRAFILKNIIHKGYLNRNNYEEVRKEIKQLYEMRKKGDKAIIYLAIETDKGLIYVAKMNDKGELELL